MVAGGSDPVRPGSDLLGGLEFRAVFDAVPDGIAIVDMQGRILELNPQFEALFGYSRAEVIGQPVEMFVPAALRDVHREHRARYGQHPYARPMGAGLSLQGCRSDGRLIPVEISLSPLCTDDGQYVICSVRDVSERMRLRKFSASTLQAAEDERLRVAQELHDDTAQELSALLLRLRLVREVADPAERDRRLDELREAIQACTEGVRRIARGLRPPALQDVGVVAAIRSHLGAVSERTDQVLDMSSDPVEDLLDADAKLVLYRVVQEAVANAVRHADADVIVVTVARTDSGVDVTVVDDGRGFRLPIPTDTGPGLGLIGMEERAASVGGRVEISTAPGEGTRVRVHIPTRT